MKHIINQSTMHASVLVVVVDLLTAVTLHGYVICAGGCRSFDHVVMHILLS